MTDPAGALPSVPPINPELKFQTAPEFVAVFNELNIHQDQLNKRQQLIRNIEKLITQRYGAENRMIAYVVKFAHPRSAINSSDLALFEELLNSISGAEQINVLIHSPGGDGTVVEKMVEMCRAHLVNENGKIRVIVPNIAKRAATLFALGADKILMGYCSELGPIDPQVPIIVSGMVQWVSALAFVESRDKLMKEIAEASRRNEPGARLLQQLGG